MRTPVVVVTGLDSSVIDSAMVSLSWDLPRAAAVRHRIDPHTQVLSRTVSDAEGVLEREDIPLDHACVSCALREDIIPTLERLARRGRWLSIVVGLPTATEAHRLTQLIARDSRLARYLKVSAVVAAARAAQVVDDLLGDDLLRDRGLHTHPSDDRGVGEVGCAQIELADLLAFDEHVGGEARDLVGALARPGVELVAGADQIDGGVIATRRHQYTVAQAWCSPRVSDDVPSLETGRAWRTVLSSALPFHPERLVDQIGSLGSGRHRSRGCFWVPTRPGCLLEWSGAGGQLSIGSHSSWGRGEPGTRLLFTGVGAPPESLVGSFDGLLLSPAEHTADQRTWDVMEDGLEPWLGDIRDVA